MLRRPSGLSEPGSKDSWHRGALLRCALAIVWLMCFNAGLCALQDPACMSYSQALLHFKGFHAIEVRQGPASLQRSAGSAWRPAAKSCSGPPLRCPGRVSPHIALRLRAGSAPHFHPNPCLAPVAALHPPTDPPHCARAVDAGPQGHGVRAAEPHVRGRAGAAPQR